jgi:hypothetical protein
MGGGEYAADPITLEETDEYLWTVSPILDANGDRTMRAVFRFDSDETIAHLDWAFGDGQVHSCDRNACAQIPVTYDREGEYTVSLVARWGDNSVTRLESNVKIY